LERVRYEVLKRFGYFVTESSEHFAEYVPWFIKRDRPDLIEQYRIPLDEYPARCERQIADWEALEAALVAGKAEDVDAAYTHSGEYASLIIHSMETGHPRVIYGNVDNNDLISNLPAEACVELPCLVDRQGIQPTQIGLLPPQLAALMQTNVNVQLLTAQAVLTQRRDHLYQAAMLDPHTAAELSTEEICSLVDDLIDAHAGMLPEFF
jgi:alpha-galactosidase